MREKCLWEALGLKYSRHLPRLCCTSAGREVRTYNANICKLGAITLTLIYDVPASSYPLAWQSVMQTTFPSLSLSFYSSRLTRNEII